MQVVLLDLFRIDVLAVAEDDDLFGASGDEQVSVDVEVTQISGVEPAILQNFCGCIGPVPVTFHHNGPAHKDFTALRRVIVGRL